MEPTLIDKNRRSSDRHFRYPTVTIQQFPRSCTWANAAPANRHFSYGLHPVPPRADPAAPAHWTAAERRRILAG
jgi:hypothetical protein